MASKGNMAFELRFDDFNEVTYAAMEASQRGEELNGPFDSVTEMLEALNA